jgi:hypothetical protein
MTTKDLDIDNWDPDFNSDDLAVWSAEWDGPEEPLEADELEKEFLMMTYRGKDVFRWYWLQIKACVDADSVTTLLEEFNINDASKSDEQELLDFFKHWIWFVSMDSKNKPTMTFEASDTLEEIGDDLLEEMESEYEKLGTPADLSQATKRTLH